METLATLDAKLFQAINLGWAHPWLDAIMRFLTSTTTWAVLSALALVFALATKQKRLLKFLILAALAIGIADPLCHYVVKPSFGRERPCFRITHRTITPGCGKQYYSFPSNHAANAAAVAVVGLATFSSYWRWIILTTSLLVGFSRVYGGFHFPTDVLAGFLYGSFIGLFVVKITRFLAKRFRLPF